MKKSEKKQVSRVKSYKITFGSKHGLEVLHDLIKSHHVLNSVYVKGDPYETHLREGERNVVLRIMSLLQIDPIKLEELIEKRERDNEYDDQF